MGYVSDQHHSISFGSGKNWMNTWEDWHLIPASRPSFNPPPVKTSYIDIPEQNGNVDTTELLGSVHYGNRTGEWEFILDPGHEPWDVRYAEVMNYLHGERMYAVLEDERYYSYNARFEVTNFQSGDNWSTITIGYNADPFKTSMFSSGTDWEWNPFDLVNGVIQPNATNIVLASTTGPKTYLFYPFKYADPPIFNVTSTTGITVSIPTTLYYRGWTRTMTTGTYQSVSNNIPYAIDFNTKEPRLIPITLSGQGTISIDYTGKAL